MHKNEKLIKEYSLIYKGFKYKIKLFDANAFCHYKVLDDNDNIAKLDDGENKYKMDSYISKSFTSNFETINENDLGDIYELIIDFLKAQIMGAIDHFYLIKE